MSITAESLRGADWFKSSYSNDQGGNCVEGARLAGRVMAVRDTKAPERGSFLFPAAAWTAFLEEVKDGATSV